MRKMMSPVETLVWVDENGVADPYNPTAAELNAGLNISCAVVRGYTLNPSGSDTDNTASICDDGNVDTPTLGNYEANMTFFRDENVADIVSVYNKAWALFRRKLRGGFIYRRVGFRQNVPFAAGQEVEGFKLLSDAPMTVTSGDGGGPVQFTVPFFQQGLHTGNVYVGPLVVPVVTSVTPSTGPITGGQDVVVAGTNFAGVTSVYVGSTEVSAPIVTPTSIAFRTPAHAAGPAGIRVVNGKGASNTDISYTYSA